MWASTARWPAISPQPWPWPSGFALSVQASGLMPPPPLSRFGGEPLTIRLLHALLLHWDPADSSLRPDHAAPGPGGRMDRPLHHLAESDPRRPTGRRTHSLRHLAPPAQALHQRPALRALCGRSRLLGRLDSLGHLPDDSRHAPPQHSAGNQPQPRPPRAGRPSASPSSCSPLRRHRSTTTP